MDNVFGDDDDLGWEGLACPPLDEYAFNNFDVACYDLDGILDDALLEVDEEEDSRGFIKHTNEVVVGVDKKTKICYGNNGKGKQLKLNLNMAGFLGDETKEVAVKKTKILDNPKYRVRQDQPGVVDNKRKAAGVDEHKLHKSSESKLMMFHHSNQPAGNDNKIPTDYNSRYEATRHKLHQLYDGIAEAKQQRRIQVIDFKKPVTEQSRCRAKAKGKTSLQQKLMAMGTHKSKKKFQPCVY